MGTINNSLTRGNRDEIVDWNLIDYSKGIQKSLDVSYTSTQDGFIIVYGGGGGQGGTGVSGRGYVNIDSIVFSLNSENLEGRVYHSSVIPIPAGTTYKGQTEGTNPILTLYWFPVKGVKTLSGNGGTLEITD